MRFTCTNTKLKSNNTIIGSELVCAFFFTVKNSGYSSFHRTTIQSCVYVCVIKQKHIERKCRCPLVRKKTAGYLGISLPCFPLLPIRFPLCCSSISPSLFFSLPIPAFPVRETYFLVVLASIQNLLKKGKPASR